jgi:shikimate kinase
MGTGKSTLGPAVADSLGWTFVDLDRIIASEAGRTIPEIFAEEGEQGFRRRESEALERVAGMEDVVVGLGGGTILDPANRERLLGTGMLVCLTARLATLVQRVLSGPMDRPLLHDEHGHALEGAALIDRIRTLLRERSAAYAAAHVMVETDEGSVEETASMIVEAVRADTRTPAG